MSEIERRRHDVEWAEVMASRRLPQDGEAGGRDETGPGWFAVAGGIRRQLPVVILWALAILVTVTALTFTLPKEYESDSSLLLDPANLGGEAQVLEALGWFTRSGQADTEVQLLTSRRVSEPTVERLGLNVRLKTSERRGYPSDLLPTLRASADAEPAGYRLVRDGAFWTLLAKDGSDPLGHAAPGERIAINGLYFTAPEQPNSADIEVEVVPIGKAVKELEQRVSVTQESADGELIRIRCTGPSPNSARLLCDGITSAYIGLRTELQRTEASTTADFLLGQAELIRGRLEAAEDSLEAYTRRNRAVALDERASQEVRQLTELMVRRQEVEAERAALAEVIRTVADGRATEGGFRDLASFPTLLRNQLVTDLAATLVELEGRKSDLAVLRTTDNPELAALVRRIGEVEQQLQQFALQYEAGLAAQGRALDVTLRESRARLQGVPIQQLDVARLERETRLLGDLYDVLESRRREAELSRAIELPAVEILDQASLPLEQASPSLARNGALALVLGLLLGALHGLVRELSDRRVRDSRTLENDLGLTVLSAIPSGASGQLLFRSTNGSARKSSNRMLGRARMAEELFRGLATDLDHVLRRATDRQLRTIAVVSPGVGDDGRALAACNLALARSSVGLPVALIDADMRGGEASRVLGFAGAEGLGEVLTTEASLFDVVRYASISSAPGAPLQSLAFLPAGARTPESAKLVRQDYLGDVLDLMVARYEFVVLNTPPAALVSDAYAIAARVDGVVVVARSGITDREQLQETIERLRRVGARIIGLVLMDAESGITAPDSVPIDTHPGAVA